MTANNQIQNKITCPICLSNKSEILWTTNSINAAQHYVLKEKYPERFHLLKSQIEILWGQNTCEVLKCDNCKFCFSNPFIAGDELFYTLAYNRTGYPSWKWEFQQTYDTINKSSRSDLKLFEIGAGDGGFVTRIADNILPNENIYCTEFSQYGKRELEKKGITCYTDDFRNLTSSKLSENFDIVCMFQVLEHLDKIDLTFQKLNWLLKDGGSLFIAVPNAERIAFNELNGALLDMPPNHIGRWNKQSFEIIGNRHGFRLKDYKIERFNFLSMSIQFIHYRMLQKSQKSGSFENRIFQINNQYLLRFSQLISFAVNLFIELPLLFKKSFRQGNSQWVHFIKFKEE
jgi:2-polyprenyl-3-methyl-5-hydroxy-6-metoxy-1,4-benzoquinol methylase